MHVRLFAHGLLGLVGSAVGLAAQAALVVPQRALQRAPGAVWNDQSLEGSVFHGRLVGLTAARTQYRIDVAEFGPAGVWDLRSLAGRPFVQIDNRTTTVTTSLSLSSTTSAHDAAVPTFAANHGTDRRVVFQGTLSLPATAGGRWPAAWSPALPFSAPFRFDGRRTPTLTVEFDTTANSRGEVWVLEGYRAEAGAMFVPGGGISCIHSGGRVAGQVGVSEQDLLPGGALRLTFSGLPSNRPSLRLNALLFGTTGLGGRVGPFTAPVALTALGIDAPPGCELSIGDLVGPPLSMAWFDFPGGQAQLRLPAPLPIPDRSWVRGMSLYLQAFAMDVSSRGPEVISTVPAGIVIGPGTPIFATRISEAYDPAQGAPTQGRVEPGRLASLRFGL